MFRIPAGRLLATLFAVLPILADSGCAPASTSAAPQPTPAVPSGEQAAAVKLTIQVTDLRSRDGQLIFGVFKTKAGFPSDESKSVNWQVTQIDTDTIVFVAQLPPGEYGASVLHDENNSNTMDTNLLGIPKEGYGVTNNPKPRFRSATFKESIFTLPAEGAELTISMQYF